MSVILMATQRGREPESCGQQKIKGSQTNVCYVVYAYFTVLLSSILKDVRRFKNSSLYKLRWVTLGYHYNWTTKLYSPLNHTPFPQDLSNLSEHILTRLGFKHFKAEAAIVNYYHMDSTLSGHTDHSEKDLNAPLISMRFVITIMIPSFVIGNSNFVVSDSLPCF